MSSSSPSCNSCDDEVGCAVAYCTDCTDFFCQTCWGAHQTVKATRSHSSFTLEKARAMQREDLLKLLPSSSLSCHDHPRQELDFYCNQCSLPVCVKCTIISHRNHTVTEAKPQAVKTKEELTKAMAVIHESEEKLKVALNTGGKTKEAIRKQKDEVDSLIRQSIASLQKLLEGREQSLIEKSNDVSLAKQTRLSHQLDTFKSLMEDMTACQDLSLTAVRDYGDVELLSIAHTLQARATELQEKFSGTSLKLCESPSINVEMNVSKIASGIASLGAVNGIDPVCPEETTAEIPSCIHVVGKELRIKLISRDSTGKRLNKGGASVTGQIACKGEGGGGKKPVSASITDSGDGTYTASFIPQQYGRQKISLSLNDTPIKNSPFNLYISRDYACISTLKEPLVTIFDIPSPFFIAIADNGDLFVTSHTHHCVYIFNSNGEYKRAIGSKGKGQLQFLQPAGIAISGNTVYVAENNGNRIHRFTRKGEFIDTFGSEGSGKGQVKYPWGICLDSNGKLYVTEYGNNRVQIFNKDGSHSHFINGTNNKVDRRFDTPEGIAIDTASHLHVTGFNSNNVAVFTLDGTFVNKYPVKGGPCGIAFDPVGYPLLSMNGGGGTSKIGIFDSSYNLTASFDKVSNVRGVAVANDGTVWVAEVGRNRLLNF